MTTLAATTVPASRVTHARRRLFFVLMPVVMALVVFVGFSPTYYLKSAYGTPPLSALYHVHGLLFTSWMLLMISQPLLVALRRTDLHRRIGQIAIFLIAAMMIAGYFAAIDMGRRGAAPPGIPPLAFMLVPMSTLVVFPVLSGAALLWRNSPQTHKRLMLIATLELVPAALGRWPILATTGPLGFFGVCDLFLVAMMLYDRRTLRRLHPATLYGGTFLIASQVVRIMLSATTTWQSLAAWLIS